MRGLTGGRVLVTGASSGLGEATALRLAEEGCRLGLVARRGDRLEALAKRIEQNGGQAVPIVGDLTMAPFAADCVAHGVKALGGLDSLVCNAGSTALRLAAAIRDSDVSSIFDLNVHPNFRLVRAAIPHLLRSTNASIILISSVAALTGQTGQSVYCASKAALVGLGRALAVELANRKVRCNVICPAFVQTELTFRAFGSLTKEQLESVRKEHPLGLGEAADVAAAVAFLASTDARWITGTVIPVDGGFTAR